MNKMKYIIRWTKNISGGEIFEKGYDKWSDINDAYRNLMEYLRASPKADGYIEVEEKKQ